MITRVTTAAGSYRVVPGDRWRTTALILAPLLDEWTRAAPSGVTARSLGPNSHAHVRAGHLVVTGLASHALPGLDTTDATVAVELRRPGRPPQTVVLTVPMGAALPYTAPAVALASTTIALAGRVTRAAFPHGPVAGAAVKVTGGTSAVLALTVPLALAHPAGSTVRERTLADGASTTLTAALTGGATVLEAASTAGITPGTVLAVGQDLVTAGSVNGPLVLLRTPAAASAAAGTAVTLQNPGTSGSATTLARTALRGDGMLPVAGALAGAVVEVVDGAATEFRRTTVTTDTDGRWRIGGVRGIPEVTLTTSAAGFVTDGPRLYPLAPVDPFVVTTALRT